MTQISVDITDAAASLGLSPDTIRKAIRSGALPAKKKGKHLIRVADLEAWFDGLEDA